MPAQEPHFDRVASGQTQACMETTSLWQWREEPCAIAFGLTLMVRKGHARIDIDLMELTLSPGAMLILFPCETVRLRDADSEFEVEALAYTEWMLRDASLQIEYMVYDAIRSDRYRKTDPTVASLCQNMLVSLRLYGESSTREHWQQVAMLQLKGFFMAYYDIMQRHPVAMKLRGSQRVHELFRLFMQEVETSYRLTRNVADYAEKLHITPKYLNTITRTVTHRTPKDLIDHQVVTQIKLSLRTSFTPLKELAAQFGFGSQTFFTQYFRQHTGTTPQQYRIRKK